jgi:hypothetical protein
MPNTGERREIKRYVNAKEDETVQESKKLISGTKQRNAKTSEEKQSRRQRTPQSKTAAKLLKSKLPATDAQGAERMVDEGDPNVTPAVKGSGSPQDSR